MKPPPSSLLAAASDGEECYDDCLMDSDDCGGGDEEALCEEDASPPEPPVECWAITKEGLAAAQQQDLSMVMTLFNIHKHHARALLIHHRWNRDRICDQLDRKGEDRMLAEAGIVLPPENGGAVVSKTKKTPSSSSSRSRRRVTCNVCFEDFSPRHVSTMDCGHAFCDDCWTGHFVAALDGGPTKQIRCMGFKCPAVCDEAVVARLLRREDPALADRFADFLLRSYVDDNDSVRWCPTSAPHCGRAVRAADPACEVECPCGAPAFCFRCAAPAHAPCPCAMWERWESRGRRGDSENLSWIMANTRSCPKCSNSIVKDGGCNLVRCKCGQCMCWLCGGATGSAHGSRIIIGHKCNRFPEEEEERKVDGARRHLRRHAHYYERFKAHGDSYRAEEGALGRAVSERARALESSSGPSGWLAGAHRTLLRCRQVLSRSYVFAYYMFDGSVLPARRQTAAERRGSTSTSTSTTTTLAKRQDLFESQQEMLEGNVERLSRLLSADLPALPEEEVVQARREAAVLVRTVEAHCGKMYGCIQDELLPLLVEPMSIVAYQPGGPSKAGLPE